MDTVIHVDTHVLLWLFDGQLDRFPDAVIEQLERQDLAVSPMVRLELDYLREIGRITEDGAAIVGDLGSRIGLRVSTARMVDVVEQAARLTWTRDPFDRMVVGNALAESCSLVTADRQILDHFEGAVWG